MGADENDGSRSLLDRRTYLKTTGIATLSGLAATGSATPAGDTVVVAADGAAAYTIEAGGAVTRTSTAGDVTDAVEDGTVTGDLTDGVAVYRVTGPLGTASVGGAATVRYDTDAASATTELLVTSPTAVEYEVTSTGPIAKVTDGGAPGDSRTTVGRNGDGTWTVRGQTGDGRVDAVVVRGEVETFSPEGGDFSVLRDGKPISPRDLGSWEASPAGRTSRTRRQSDADSSHRQG